MTKILEFYDAYVMPSSTSRYDLGTTLYQFKNIYSCGTAYLYTIGTNYTVNGTFKQYFGDSTVYVFSSATGYLTFVAGTQIDLQSNIGVSAKNFIFDTVTGVKFGTATNQKLAFFGTAPVVQLANTVDIKDGLIQLGFYGTGTGATNLDLDGGILISGGVFFTGGLAYSLVQLGTGTAAYTLGTDEAGIVCYAEATVTLPAAIGSGRSYIIKNAGTATSIVITIGTDTGDTIDGLSSITVKPREAATIVDSYLVGGTSGGGDFSYKKVLTVNTASVFGSLANYPALVRLTSANMDFSHYASTAGIDVSFTDTAGNTLSHQIAYFATATQLALYWVSLPTITTGTAYDYYMYYGCATAADISTTAVWDTGYAAVWHLCQTVTTATNGCWEYTSNARHGQGGTGTAASCPGAVVSATWGQSALFVAGSVKHISVPDSAAWENASGFTWSCWLVHTATTNQSLFGRGTGSSYLYWAMPEGGGCRFRDYNGGTDWNLGVVMTFTTGVLRRFEVSWDGTVWLMFNGTAQLGTRNAAFTWIDRTTVFWIGACINISYNVSGWMNEAMVHTVARGTGWTRTSVAAEQGLLFTYGTEVAVGSTSTTNGWIII